MKLRNTSLLICLLTLPSSFGLISCSEKFNTCENTLDCPDGGSTSTGGETASGGANSSGGAGGASTGGSSSGGTGGSTTDPCDACDAPTPACNDAKDCVECTGDAHCDGDAGLCDTSAEKCVECLAASDCSDPSAAKCTEGACGACTVDDDCAHVEGKTVCDGDTGACVACTPETEEAQCGEFSCSSLTNTCTTTKRGILGTCQACEADSECAVDRKCVMDQFEGADVGYFCFLEQGSTGCGNVEVLRRPYRSIVETTSLDGTMPQNFCLPPSSTTCQGIGDTQDVNCSSSDECGMDGLDDGYCPTAGDGAGACSYRCTGGFECVDGLECSDSPQHCNPE